MRQGIFAEKRKFERLKMAIPVTLKHVSDDGKEQLAEGVTSDVSYSGAFVKDLACRSLKPNDSLRVSLTVPRDSARDFPFSRFSGKAKVVRVAEDGVALEFGEQMLRLFVAN